MPETHATAERLHLVLIHLFRKLSRVDVKTRLSAARLSALSVIGFAGPVTIGEVAAIEEVTPPTMTRLVASLEADGLVERSQHPLDRRAVMVHWTERGRSVMMEARARRVDELERRLMALGAEDLQILESASNILERLVASWDVNATAASDHKPDPHAE